MLLAIDKQPRSQCISLKCGGSASRDYNSLQTILRQRADKLDVSRLALDEAAGLTEGHASKLLASSQIKGLNRCLLGALGLVLIVATDDDPAVRARIARMPRRKGAGQDNPANSRSGAPHGRQTQQHRCVAGARLKLPVIGPTYFAQQLTRPYPAWALSQGAPVLCGSERPSLSPITDLL